MLPGVSHAFFRRHRFGHIAHILYEPEDREKGPLQHLTMFEGAYAPQAFRVRSSMHRSRLDQS
eukprot:11160317-Lingulodinium_polyedra.AAC.1